MCTYFLDRTDLLGRTATNRRRTGTATVAILTDEWVRLDVTIDDSTANPPRQRGAKGSINNEYAEKQNEGGVLQTEGAAGTRWMYLRVPSIDGEWHPFSLRDRTASVIIKAAGDWTKRLHTTCSDACSKGGHGRLAVEVDGVYGNASPPWRAYDRVLLIGGGVGITPWLPMMDANFAAAAAAGGDAGLRSGSIAEGGVACQQCSLIWVARDRTEYTAMAKWLPEQTTVFLTRESPEAVADIVAAVTSADDAAEEEGTPSTLSSSTAKATAVHRSRGAPAFVALVCMVTMVTAYMAYYVAVLTPDENDSGDDDDGGGGCGGPNCSNNGSNGTGNGSAPSGTMPWEPTTLWSYFLVKRFVPVACSALATVAAAVLCRVPTARCTAGRRWKLRCPFPTGASTRAAPTQSRDGSSDRVGIGAAGCFFKSASPEESKTFDGKKLVTMTGHHAIINNDIRNGRPDFKALVSGAAASVVAAMGRSTSSNGSSSIGGACRGASTARGLFVCVCGPPGMVRAVQAAVAAAKAEHSGMDIGFHAEQPAW